MSNLKHNKLVQEILDTVPKPRLVGAALFIDQHRRKRSGLQWYGYKLEGEDAENILTDILATATIRQLKLLRKIALGLEEHVERMN